MDNKNSFSSPPSPSNNNDNNNLIIKDDNCNIDNNIDSISIDITLTDKENTIINEKCYNSSKENDNDSRSNNDLEEENIKFDNINFIIKPYTHKYTLVRIFIYILIFILVIFVLNDFIKILINPDDYFYGMLYPLSDEPILNIVSSSLENNTSDGIKEFIVERLLQLNVKDYNNYIYKTYERNTSLKIFHYFIILALTIISSYVVNTIYYILIEK